MNHGNKKFKTPIALHKKLGNTYAVESAERQDFRRRMKGELRTMVDESIQHKFDSTSATHDMMDNAVLTKQLQLEMQVEQLTLLVNELKTRPPDRNTPASAEDSYVSIPLSDIPKSQTLPSVSGTPYAPPRTESHSESLPPPDSGSNEAVYNGANDAAAARLQQGPLGKAEVSLGGDDAAYNSDDNEEAHMRAGAAAATTGITPVSAEGAAKAAAAAFGFPPTVNDSARGSSSNAAAVSSATRPQQQPLQSPHRNQSRRGSLVTLMQSAKRLVVSPRIVTNATPSTAASSKSGPRVPLRSSATTPMGNTTTNSTSSTCNNVARKGAGGVNRSNNGSGAGSWDMGSRGGTSDGADAEVPSSAASAPAAEVAAGFPLVGGRDDMMSNADAHRGSSGSGWGGGGGGGGAAGSADGGRDADSVGTHPRKHLATAPSLTSQVSASLALAHAEEEEVRLSEQRMNPSREGLRKRSRENTPTKPKGLPSRGDEDVGGGDGRGGHAAQDHFPSQDATAASEHETAGQSGLPAEPHRNHQQPQEGRQEGSGEHKLTGDEDQSRRSHHSHRHHHHRYHHHGRHRSPGSEQQQQSPISLPDFNDENNTGLRRQQPYHKDQEEEEEEKLRQQKQQQQLREEFQGKVQHWLEFAASATAENQDRYRAHKLLEHSRDAPINRKPLEKGAALDRRSHTQPQHHPQQSAQPQVGSRAATGSPGFFVLSSAPSLTVDTLLSQQLETMVLSNPMVGPGAGAVGHENGVATVGSVSSQYSPLLPAMRDAAAAGGGGGGVHSSGSVLGAQPSIQDQIYRFAEIRALFEMPVGLTEEESSLLEVLTSAAGGGGVYPGKGAGEGVGYEGRGVDGEDISGGANTHRQRSGSPTHRPLSTHALIQHMQVDEVEEAKRRTQLEKHKQRLAKARMRPQRFPLVPPGPGTAVSAAAAGARAGAGTVAPPVSAPSPQLLRGKSPRAKIHQARFIPHPGYYRSAGLAAGGVASAGAADGGAAATAGAITAIGTGGVDGNQQNDAEGQSTRQLPSSAPAAPTSSSFSASGGSAVKSSSGPPVPPLSSSSSSQSPEKKIGSAANAAIAAGTEGPSAVDMTLEEFNEATSKITKKINHLVKDVIDEELRDDFLSQHFTKRSQNAVLAKSKKPLLKSIRQRVEGELNELRKELVKLRASKVNLVPEAQRKRRGGGNSSGGGAGDGGTRRHSQSSVGSDSDAGSDDGAAGSDDKDVNRPASGNECMSKRVSSRGVGHAGHAGRAGRGGHGGTSRRHGHPSTRMRDHNKRGHSESPVGEVPNLDLKRSVESVLAKHTEHMTEDEKQSFLAATLNEAQQGKGGTDPSMSADGTGAISGLNDQNDSEAMEALSAAVGSLSAPVRGPIPEGSVEDSLGFEQDALSAQHAAAEREAEAKEAEAEREAEIAAVLAAAAAEEQEVEEEKPRKLTKAERMLGMTEPVGTAGPAAPTPPDQSVKRWGLGGLFGKGTASNKGMSSRPVQAKSKRKPSLGSIPDEGGHEMSDDDDDGQHSETGSRGSRGSRGGKRKGKKKAAAAARSAAEQFTDFNSPVVASLAANSKAGSGGGAGSSSNPPSIMSAKDVAELEEQLADEVDHLTVLLGLKSKVKQELKDWERDFMRRVGRPPSDADKSAIEDRFLAYRSVTMQVKESGARTKSLEAQLIEANS